MATKTTQTKPKAQHYCTMRLTAPFMRLLRSYQGFPVELLGDGAAHDADERVPVTAMHELLRGAVAITGDQDLGLKAARCYETGDYGALEYAASSAATVGDALEMAGRYMALINDALSFSFVKGEEVITMRTDSTVLLPRAAEDFMLGSLWHASARHRPAGPAPRHEVHFTYTRPRDTSEYLATFPTATLRFSQPYAAMALPRAYFDRALPSADPKLHAVIRKHADQLMAELPRASSFTSQVRDLLMAELAGGNPSATRIASMLHMSSRTLSRKLEQEGTTFKALLDDMRKALALKYVGGSELPLSEVAFLLSFSQVAAFHRAFKRWTGGTPLEHRRAMRR